MAKYLLTWMPGATPRWRKVYRGKVYYFSGKPSKTLSYRPALEEWQRLKEKLDQDADPHAARQAELLRELRRIASQDTSGAFRAAVSETLGLAVPLPGSTSPLLKPLIEKFLAEKQQDNLSAGRYDGIRRALDHFMEWHGDRLCVDGSTLPEYRAHCLPRGPRWASDKLSCLKLFIRWCWEREVIDSLPRTFKASVKVKYGKPKTWDVATFRAIYESAPDRIKLYLLLMANCGMYSGDISDLRPDEVDWTRGAIRRSRSKTPDNEPTEWKLWPETLKLLRAFRSDDADHVLLTRTGRPLKVDTIRDDGRRSLSDSVRQEFIRWCKRNGYPSPPALKQLRHTGATLIASRFGDAAAVAYLGHTGRTVAQVHYIAVTLDDALDWLRAEMLGV